MQRDDVPATLTPQWFDLRPHSVQEALWTCPDRFVAVRAGRRSGKTTLAKRRLVRYLPVRLWHGQPARYLYVAPTRDQAKHIAWNDLKALCHPHWLAGEPRESELVIRSVWGSEIHVSGFDKPARIEGVPWDGVVVDESADIRPGAVDKSLRPALADRRGWMWRIGVPKRAGIGAAEFRKICEDRSKGYRFFTWSAEDILDPSELAHMAQHLDHKDYDEQIKGLAVSSSSRAFDEFEPEFNVLAGPATQYQPNRTIAVGSDFNVNPMAWVIAHVIGGSIYVFDELWLRNTNTRAALNELHRRYGDHKAGWIFFGDASGRARKTVGTSASNSDYLLIKQDARFAESEGGVQVRYPKANPGVKNRLASCNAMLCNAMEQRRLLINPSCTHLIEDLDQRGVDQQGQPLDATPDTGHITDALGYMVHAMFPVRFSMDESEGEHEIDMQGLSVMR